ncbi:putative Ubiquitin carboxyl-terminal hydrolase [Blattamonas nauphoetae]|uniref:Ubiquitin carboxyl-terminal hydrolase n=1 Tax=Blattamonas nauphoetae TaxID=2049346 RepID=A0ABQ9X0E4_9EUKA|nr:putative Ubiquitin carboxyl-terminal hydrolase [Blattamonas nauphoetae]
MSWLFSESFQKPEDLHDSTKTGMRRLFNLLKSQQQSLTEFAKTATCLHQDLPLPRIAFSLFYNDNKLAAIEKYQPWQPFLHLWLYALIINKVTVRKKITDEVTGVSVERYSILELISDEHLHYIAYTLLISWNPTILDSIRPQLEQFWIVAEINKTIPLTLLPLAISTSKEQNPSVALSSLLTLINTVINDSKNPFPKSAVEKNIGTIISRLLFVEKPEDAGCQNETNRFILINLLIVASRYIPDVILPELEKVLDFERTQTFPPFTPLPHFIVPPSPQSIDDTFPNHKLVTDQFSRVVIPYQGMKNPGGMCYATVHFQSLFMNPLARALLLGDVPRQISGQTELTPKELESLCSPTYYPVLDTNACFNISDNQTVLSTITPGNRRQNFGREIENVWEELGRLFARMQSRWNMPFYSYIPHYETIDDLAKTILDDSGNPISVKQYDDTSHFFGRLMWKLSSFGKEQCVPNTFRHLFFSDMAESTVCPAGHESYKNQHRTPLHSCSVLLGNRLNSSQSDLENSLASNAEMAIPPFVCPDCKTTQNAVKRMLIRNLPHTLNFHLRRFTFEDQKPVKVNSRFVFPMELDMWPYTEEGFMYTRYPQSAQQNGIDDHQYIRFGRGRQYYDYQLVGMILHDGTQSTGHYFAYFMERTCTVSKTGTNVNVPPRWYQFNDQVVEIIPDITERMKVAFGDPSSTCSAMMLVYERKQALPIWNMEKVRQHYVDSPWSWLTIKPDDERFFVENQRSLIREQLLKNAQIPSEEDLIKPEFLQSTLPHRRRVQIYRIPKDWAPIPAQTDPASFPVLVYSIYKYMMSQTNRQGDIDKTRLDATHLWITTLNQVVARCQTFPTSDFYTWQVLQVEKQLENPKLAVKFIDTLTAHMTAENTRGSAKTEGLKKEPTSMLPAILLNSADVSRQVAFSRLVLTALQTLSSSAENEDRRLLTFLSQLVESCFIPFRNNSFKLHSALLLLQHLASSSFRWATLLALTNTIISYLAATLDQGLLLSLISSHDHIRSVVMENPLRSSPLYQPTVDAALRLIQTITFHAAPKKSFFDTAEPWMTMKLFRLFLKAGMASSLPIITAVATYPLFCSSPEEKTNPNTPEIKTPAKETFLDELVKTMFLEPDLFDPAFASFLAIYAFPRKSPQMETPAFDMIVNTMGKFLDRLESQPVRVPVVFTNFTKLRNESFVQLMSLPPIFSRLLGFFAIKEVSDYHVTLLIRHLHMTIVGPITLGPDRPFCYALSPISTQHLAPPIGLQIPRSPFSSATTDLPLPQVQPISNMQIDPLPPPPPTRTFTFDLTPPAQRVPDHPLGFLYSFAEPVTMIPFTRLTQTGVASFAPFPDFDKDRGDKLQRFMFKYLINYDRSTKGLVFTTPVLLLLAWNLRSYGGGQEYSNCEVKHNNIRIARRFVEGKLIEWILYRAQKSHQSKDEREHRNYRVLLQFLAAVLQSNNEIRNNFPRAALDRLADLLVFHKNIENMVRMNESHAQTIANHWEHSMRAILCIFIRIGYSEATEHAQGAIRRFQQKTEQKMATKFQDLFQALGLKKN